MKKTFEGVNPDGFGGVGICCCIWGGCWIVVCCFRCSAIFCWCICRFLACWEAAAQPPTGRVTAESLSSYNPILNLKTCLYHSLNWKVLKWRSERIFQKNKAWAWSAFFRTFQHDGRDGFWRVASTTCREAEYEDNAEYKDPVFCFHRIVPVLGGRLDQS